MNGKGSKPRPSSFSKTDWARRHDEIFKPCTSCASYESDVCKGCVDKDKWRL